MNVRILMNRNVKGEDQTWQKHYVSNWSAAWKLVSYVEKPVDGSEPFYPMGREPQGIIMYTR